MEDDRREINADAVNRVLREGAKLRLQRLREASEIWDEMATEIADTEWDKAWRRSL